MNKKTVKDIDIKGKRVLMRVDFNVPMQDGKVTDDKRIRASLPTIQYVLAQGASLILMSHLGRPKGGPDPVFSLKPASEVLAGLLGKPVQMAPDCVGPDVEKMAKALKPGDVLMLENTRFHAGEEKNDLELAKQMAVLGDVYVNDAFGSAHRAHSSTEGVTHFIKLCAAGYLMEKEINYLSSAINNPKRPMCAILGGAKISGKIDVLENLMNIADKILIGGGMSFTFFKAMGLNIGKSILEEDKISFAKDILEKAKALKKEILFPADIIIADKFENDAVTKIVNFDNIESEWMGMDIGPQTIKKYTKEINESATIVWNGPMGVFEMSNFSKGTFEIAKALADVTSKGAITIIGGGDSASAVAKAGLEEKVSHVSTGGGASLEFLEGKVLPGVNALTNK